MFVLSLIQSTTHTNKKQKSKVRKSCFNFLTNLKKNSQVEALLEVQYASRLFSCVNTRAASDKYIFSGLVDVSSSHLSAATLPLLWPRRAFIVPGVRVLVGATMNPLSTVFLTVKRPPSVLEAAFTSSYDKPSPVARSPDSGFGAYLVPLSLPAFPVGYPCREPRNLLPSAVQSSCANGVNTNTTPVL